jgi:hypothetical protein
MHSSFLLVIYAHSRFFLSRTGFSPEIFSPEIFSPEIFSPEIEIAFLPEMDYSKNQGLHVIRLFTDQTITTLYS